MLYHNMLGIFICAFLAVSESKFVDTLSRSKCSIKDGACQGALITASLKAIHKTGVPELGIPPIDPIEFKDISISILDLVVLNAVDGVAKGVKDCIVNSFNTDIEKGHSQMEMTCHSFTIKSKYKLSGSSPVIKNLLGGESITGDGNGKVKIEKIKLRIDYFYDMAINEDGDVYFRCKFNKTVYDYEFLGKVSFAADDIRLGNQDATSSTIECCVGDNLCESQLVVGFLNENAKFIMSTFGKIFLDKAMEIVYVHTHKFFDVVPAKNFIIEDLSEYVKS